MVTFIDISYGARERQRPIQQRGAATGFLPNDLLWTLLSSVASTKTAIYTNGFSKKKNNLQTKKSHVEEGKEPIFIALVAAATIGRVKPLGTSNGRHLKPI